MTDVDPFVARLREEAEMCHRLARAYRRLYHVALVATVLALVNVLWQSRALMVCVLALYAALLTAALGLNAYVRSWRKRA